MLIETQIPTVKGKRVPLLSSRSRQPSRARFQAPAFSGLPIARGHGRASPRRAVVSMLLALLAVSFLSLASPVSAQESANLLARKGNAALVRKENDKAIAALSEALSVSSIPVYTRASILNDRGLAFAREKKFELALNDFNKAIESFPEYAIAYNNRGLLLHNLGFYREAIKDFNRAIALQPGQGATFHNRANALRKAGAEKTAFKDYGKALKLLDDKSAPHLARGQIHWSHYRHYAALRELNLALDQNKDHAEALYNRGQVYLSLDETAEAIRDIAKATDLAPQNAAYQMTLAGIYLEKGQHNSARNLASEILEAEPDNAEALLLRGRALGAVKKYDAAINDLNKAISLKDNAAAYAERALVYAAADMPELSNADMDTAIQRAPDNARSWVALGQAGQFNELTTSAERYYREALKLEKGNKDALKGLEELDVVTDAIETTEELVGEAEPQWTVAELGKGRYVASHPKYKRLEIPLDLYGPAEPKVLEWTELNGNYKGFGLLRYNAGIKDTKKAYEQVVIINLRKQKVLSIEPYRWGPKVADWKWSKREVVVMDPDGIANTVVLRTPVKRPPARVARDRYDNDDGFWISGPNQRAARPKKRTRVRRKKKKGFFGIFGF